MSLRTGTSLIVVTLLINKLSGLYGLLALFTGIHLNSLQLSMYTYSLLALFLTSALAPHVRKGSPLQCLALAWFYAIDSAINAAYTAAFGVAWFLVLAQHAGPIPGGNARRSLDAPLVAGTMDEAAGFTKPEFDVSSVDVLDGALVGHTDAIPASSSHNGGSLQHTILQSGSVASITVISLLWMLRVYFMLVVFAYARGVLRQHVITSATAAGQLASTSDGRLAEDPFAVGKELGVGWGGKLGRAMVSVGRNYWLGPDEQGEWVRDVGQKFQSGAGAGGRSNAKGGEGAGVGPGVGERERRRRAGTGPPKPPALNPIELDEVRK